MILGIKGFRLFVGCYDIFVYNDVFMEDIILEFILILMCLEFYVVLSEIMVFVGCEIFFFYIIIF